MGSEDNKELIFFAIFFMFTILCDVIHGVLDKHYMFTSDRLIDQAIGQFWKRLASVIAAKGGHTEEHFG